jgi:TonB-linked SusC/RagA family outer membrane protein
MKIIAIILFASLTTVANNTYSQFARFSLSVNELTIKECFEYIEGKSEFIFIYNSDKLEVGRKVSVEADDVPVEILLEQVLENTNHTYKINDRQIIIYENVRETDLNIKDSKSTNQRKINGVVNDSKGNAIPGVSVIIKGTTTGTITDLDGKYSIDIDEQTQTLVFSFVGMKRQEVKVADKITINVILEEESFGLEEVVAIGYGSVRKSDLTGAITSLKAEEMTTSATASVTQMIQGKSSGVMIQQVSGQPGGGFKIQIRGESTVNSGTEPLYIIDGFPVFNEEIEPGGASHYQAGKRNPLNSINPNDIESIEILKDAASTSIYGARAANGVVLITTKKGTQGTKVSYSGKFSVQKMDTYVKLLNAEDYAKYYNMYLYESMLFNKNMFPYGSVPADTSLFRMVYPQGYIDTIGNGTNWLDEVTRIGKIHDHNISISGGSDKVKYYSSFGYYDQEGILTSTAFSRMSGRLNLDAQLTENIKFGVNITGSQNKNLNGALGGAKWSEAGQLAHALSFPPTIPVYRADGSYTDYSDDPYQSVNSIQHNPVSYNDINDVTITNRMLSSAFMEVSIIDGLKFKASVGIDKLDAKRDSYIPKTVKTGADKGGIASIGYGNSSTSLLDVVLNYNKIIKENHNLSALAGYSYQKFNKEGFNNSASNFFTDNLLTNSIGLGNQATYKIGSYKDETKLASFFTRVNYNYQGKYIFSASLRADGSDKFGAKKRWGYFPGASIGWAMHKEDFMSSIEYISMVKPRISFGQSGNASFYGNAFSLYSTDARYAFSNAIVTGVQKTQLENPYLTWETTTEANFGLDFGLFKNRITGSLEYFNKQVSDLLELQRMQIYHEVSRVWQNAGTIQTNGYEMQINAIAVDKVFKWKIDLNLSTYVTKWKERSADNIIAMSSTDKIDDYVRPLYLYEVSHIMMPDEELPSWMPSNTVPGDVIINDVDGWATNENGEITLDENNRKIHSGAPDGKIDDADKTFRGNKDPKLIFGFGNTFEYKGFDLNIFCYGMHDYWFQNENVDRYILRADYFYNGGYVPSYDYLERFSSFNLDSPKYPATLRNGGGSHEANYNQMWEKVSFLRVKNITLGYNFPNSFFGTKIRVYIEGNNLFLFSNLKNMDPETTNAKDNQWSHGAQGLYAYPSQKTLTFGVQIDF